MASRELIGYVALTLWPVCLVAPCHSFRKQSIEGAYIPMRSSVHTGLRGGVNVYLCLFAHAYVFSSVLARRDAIAINGSSAIGCILVIQILYTLCG